MIVVVLAALNKKRPRPAKGILGMAGTSCHALHGVANMHFALWSRELVRQFSRGTSLPASPATTAGGCGRLAGPTPASVQVLPVLLACIHLVWWLRAARLGSPDADPSQFGMVVAVVGVIVVLVYQSEGGLPARNGLAAPVLWPGVFLSSVCCCCDCCLLSSAGWVAGSRGGSFLNMA